MRASEAIEALLEARGSTKKWLAAQLGLSPSALSRYLDGSRPPPRDFYQRVSSVLQVPEVFLHDVPESVDNDEVAPPPQGAAA